MKKFILSALAVLCAMQLGAKDYNASLFGIKSNGTTLNTSSIQKAIDYIHSEGGGRLVFYVGRYLTGSINLRSNVTIQLNEGAVLLGSTNPYDYPIDSSYCALVRAVKVDNVAITGKGVIDGQGREASYNLLDQIQKGIINDPAKYDRPDGSRRARTLYFRECKDVTIDGITLKNSGDWVQTYDQCDRLKINGITEPGRGAFSGKLCCVIFSPNHLSLVRDGPAERRDFLIPHRLPPERHLCCRPGRLPRRKHCLP